MNAYIFFNESTIIEATTSDIAIKDYIIHPITHPLLNLLLALYSQL